MISRIKLKVKDNIASVVIDGKLYSTACDEFIEIELNKQDTECTGNCEECDVVLPESLKHQAD